MVSTDIIGTIFNIQKFSVHDGPGIRTTVFMKGCPLQCRWCSNAESMRAEPEPGIIRETCDLCSSCIDGCPLQALARIDDRITIDRDRCNACGECVSACPAGAITIYGRKTGVGEVLQEVLKDRDFYTGSGGGVTVSGGEPLRQSPFVRELFRRCREEGIGTCLDTCGFAPEENMTEVLSYTDFVLYDLKLMDQDDHRTYTGVRNDLIKTNAKAVVNSGVDVLFRIPLIQGVNSDQENIEATARFIDTLGPGHTVELLPYHRLGIGKYRTLDREYPGTDLKTPDDEDIEMAKAIFSRWGITCLTGG